MNISIRALGPMLAACRPENLGCWDLMRVQARQVGSKLWLAERVAFERPVRC